MAPVYLSPGVYVEEIEKGARPIEGVGTAVAGFVGFCQKGPENTPVLVTNWTQFRETFGDFIPGSYLAHAVYGYFNNGGGRCYIVRVTPSKKAEEAPAVSNVALPSRSEASADTLQLSSVSPEPGEVQVEVAEASENPPEQFKLVLRKGQVEEVFDNLTFQRGRGARNVEGVINDPQAGSRLVRARDLRLNLATAERLPRLGTYVLPGAAPLAPRQVTAIVPQDFQGNVAQRTGMGGLEVPDDVTMLVCPDLMAAYQQGALDLEGVQAVQTAMITHCEKMKDRVAILDVPPGMKPQEVLDWRMNKVRYDSKFACLYYPWIRVYDPLQGKNIPMPPSGHLAGLYTRVDGTRGVHKAPANEVIRGALDLEYSVTKEEQEGLNPNGINCIRAFPGRGIRVWGARTLSSDAQWRYLNVRRLFNFVEKSIERGTQWVVFEPNDYDLWQRIKRDISAFLTRVWRDGALFGLTPQQAFYVKCDDETNPPEVIDAGQVVVEIGIAPVKPAEFVIFRISQLPAGGGVSE